MPWLYLILPILVLILISLKNLWLGIAAGSFLFGILHFNFQDLIHLFTKTVTSLPILLLAFSVSLIPLVGGLMQETGIFDKMVSSLTMKRKTFLMFSPSLLGLLPIPGGAILSCPLITKAGNDISGLNYLTINIWFRHIFVIIYPLSALLACSKMARVSLYSSVLHLVPAFIIMLIMGYVFLVKKIPDRSLNRQEDILKTNKRNKSKYILIPIVIILVSPLFHFVFISLNIFTIDEVPLIIGLLVSLLLTVYFGKARFHHFSAVTKKLRPERFFLLIIFIFFFLKLVQTADIEKLISSIRFSDYTIFIFLPFVLTIITGRIQIGISLMLPILFTNYNVNSLTAASFSIVYFSVFLGYLISPLHPCLSFSIEYFRTNYFSAVIKLLPLVALSLFVNSLILLFYKSSGIVGF